MATMLTVHWEWIGNFDESTQLTPEPRPGVLSKGVTCFSVPQGLSFQRGYYSLNATSGSSWRVA